MGDRPIPVGMGHAMENFGVSAQVYAAYDQQYQDTSSEWRDLGGKYKARNILQLCEGMGFRRAMECGAGDGSILKYLAESGRFESLSALDISESAIERIRNRNIPTVREVEKFDGVTIPYKDGEFDLAYCSHVVEHVEHPRVLMREIARVSRYQVFEVPLDYSIGIDRKIDHYLSYGHINVYTPSLFRFLLRSEGFEIEAELMTHLATEVRRYKDYEINGLKKTVLREARIAALPFLRAAKRAVYGSKRFDEHAYSAYTCLTRRTGEMQILQSGESASTLC